MGWGAKNTNGIFRTCVYCGQDKELRSLAMTMKSRRSHVCLECAERTTLVCRKCGQEKPLRGFIKTTTILTNGYQVRQTICHACASRKKYHGEDYEPKPKKRYVTAKSLYGKTEYANISEWVIANKRNIRYRMEKVNPNGSQPLEPEDLVKVWNDQAGLDYYTGKPMSLKKLSLKDGFMGSPSIDRKDPHKGYVPGNVVFVTYRTNRNKGNMSETEFIEFCRQVAAYHPQPLTFDN